MERTHAPLQPALSLEGYSPLVQLSEDQSITQEKKKLKTLKHCSVSHSEIDLLIWFVFDGGPKQPCNKKKGSHSCSGCLQALFRGDKSPSAVLWLSGWCLPPGAAKGGGHGGPGNSLRPWIALAGAEQRQAFTVGGAAETREADKSETSHWVWAWKGTFSLRYKCGNELRHGKKKCVMGKMSLFAEKQGREWKRFNFFYLKKKKLDEITFLNQETFV